MQYLEHYVCSGIELFLPEHGTRSVDKNYTMFKEFIALTMKEHIPNKLTSTRTSSIPEQTLSYIHVVTL